MARPSICHGVTWSTGQPTLLVTDPATGTLRHRLLTDASLGFRVLGPESFCTGRYRFVDTHQVEPVPCPHQAPADSGGQCRSCSSADEFRLAHHYHRGGDVPAALRAYMAQPHWLYLATFAKGLTKVGTAAMPRTLSRLNEQGPLQATYLAQAPDGRAVRLLEDALSSELGITQSVRGSAKTAPLLRPDLLPDLSEHDRLVETALTLLTAWGVTAQPHRWQPPPAASLLTARTDSARDLYPHDVRIGEHGLTIQACLGGRVLAHLHDHDDPTDYVLDLGPLKSRAIELGTFRSARAITQPALF